MNKIYVTQQDHQRLHELVVLQRSYNGNSNNTIQLGGELKRANKVNSEDILACIVTMNSKVRLLELKSKKEIEVTLVYPKDMDIHARKVSVLAPVGIAILGCREGDVVEIPAPSGSTLMYLIEKVVYQPEASGDFHL
jgi:regulator of nucleoside diphosphate kinase